MEGAGRMVQGAKSLLGAHACRWHFRTGITPAHGAPLRGGSRLPMALLPCIHLDFFFFSLDRPANCCSPRLKHTSQSEAGQKKTKKTKKKKKTKKTKKKKKKKKKA
jgi:hypothetical protein